MNCKKNILSKGQQVSLRSAKFLLQNFCRKIFAAKKNLAFWILPPFFQKIFGALNAVEHAQSHQAEFPQSRYNEKRISFVLKFKIDETIFRWIFLHVSCLKLNHLI